jgi:hypothetical protein
LVVGDFPSTFWRGAHICHLFEDYDEQKAFVLPCVRQGLSQNEACLVIVGRQSVDDWYVELQAQGIDVQRERERLALDVVTGEDYRRPGDFSSVGKARELLELMADRLRYFRGLRIVGDVAWESEPPLSADRVCHWEATANLVFENQDVRVVCQYDKRTDSPALLHAALRTHRDVLVGGRVFSNPFFDGPAILSMEPHLNSSTADRTKIEAIIQEITAPNTR